MTQHICSEKLLPLTYQSSVVESLPFRQGIFHGDLPGAPAVLLFLHGAGERGNDNQVPVHFGDEIVEYLESRKEKCVVILPQCGNDCQWVDTPWGDPVHTFREEPSLYMQAASQLLDDVICRFNADRRRIYVTGISMGGYGSWDILCRRKDLFAAGMPICGGGDCNVIAQRLAKMPLRFFHGGVDSVVPVENSRSIARALEQASSRDFLYTEIPGCDHNSWTQTYKDFANFDWLFAQKRN